MSVENAFNDRTLSIGGSDLGVILGFSSYMTPYELYLEKIGSLTREYKESPNAEWGKILEPVIREQFSIRSNVTVETPDTIFHDKFKFLSGNLDGFIPEWNDVLDIKCSNSFMTHSWGEQDTDDIPLSYLVQLAYYCWLTNANRGHIALLIGGYDYRTYVYNRDEELEKLIYTSAIEFWDGVMNRVPPQASNISDLHAMYKDTYQGSEILASKEIKAEYDSLVSVKKEMKELKEKEEDHKFNIIKHMGANECLVDADGKKLATCKANKRGTKTFLIK